MNRRNPKKSNYIRSGCLAVLVLLTVVCWQNLKAEGNASIVEELLRQLQGDLYQKVLSTHMPNVLASTAGNQKPPLLQELFLEKILAMLPIQSYTMSLQDYETQVESELTYEMLAAREGADENYRDGELVGEDSSKTDGEASVDEKGETGKEGGKDEPSGAEGGKNESSESGAEGGKDESSASEAENGKDDKAASGEAGGKDGSSSGAEGAKDGKSAPGEADGKDKKSASEKGTGKDEESAAEDGAKADSAGEDAAAAAAKPPVSPAAEPAAQLSLEKLNDFDYLIQHFYVVDKTTTIDSSQLNAGELLAKDLKLKTPSDQPQILIHHTHSQEGYADSNGDASTSIVAVGEYLAQLLRGYGFNVIHDTNAYDLEDHMKAYSYAGPATEQILAEHPSIEVVIDMHRDGIKEGHLVTEVNGKQTAKIMFFNGLSRTTANGDLAYLYNPYIQDNLAFSLQMKVAAEQYYPGFTRANYLKGYRYNLHYVPKSMLVEVGAQTNTVEEAMNAMEPLADLLHKVLMPQ